MGNKRSMTTHSAKLRVLVAVDESHESRDAVEFATRILGENAEFVVLSVASIPLVATAIADPFGGGYIPSASAEEVVGGELHRAEDAADEAASEAAAPVETRVESGDAAAEICRIAAEESFDLIVVGSHDRSWFSKLVSRSVRDHLVEHAPCPLLIVRQ